MRNRRKKPGPFSRDQALTDADRRTRAGRVLKSVIGELLDHMGDATAPQRLLVQSAALKATRMALMSDQLLNGQPPSEGSDGHALAWLNSMRLDLMALGLERKMPAAIDLHDYIKTVQTTNPDGAAKADGTA
jgi:hypothetical protein